MSCEEREGREERRETDGVRERESDGDGLRERERERREWRE